MNLKEMGILLFDAKFDYKDAAKTDSIQLALE